MGQEIEMLVDAMRIAGKEKTVDAMRTVAEEETVDEEGPVDEEEGYERRWIKLDIENVWVLQVAVHYIWTLVLCPCLLLLSWMRWPVHF